MPSCPDCEAKLDVEEDEVEQGEVINCPECGVELEVLNTNPLEVKQIEEEEEEEEEDQSADARGELVVRLPAASAVYVIEATAPGFTCDSEELCSVADERQDVVLHIITPAEINRQPGQRGIAP